MDYICPSCKERAIVTRTYLKDALVYRVQCFSCSHNDYVQELSGLMEYDRRRKSNAR
jgi:hypothetical protein